MLDLYFDEIMTAIERARKQEHTRLIQAAEKISQCIQANGIVHLFGCGHSHLLTEEAFYRAGGLAPIHPILVEELMLHKGAARSSQLERQNDFAQSFMENQDIRKEDIFIVISTSGINPVPIDAAKLAKEKGTFVIALTSLEYSKSRPSRHKSGQHLYDVADLIIDNHAPKGDTLIAHEALPIKFGSGSTIIGATILNSIFVKAIQIMADQGFEPPIFFSGNTEGADQHNKRLIELYKKRIPFLDGGNTSL